MSTEKKKLEKAYAGIDGAIAKEFFTHNLQY